MASARSAQRANTWRGRWSDAGARRVSRSICSPDRALFGDALPAPTQEAVVLKMTHYLQRQMRIGVAPRHIVRHMLGLFQGLRGARQWRRTLSDADALQRYGADVLMVAFEAVRDPPALLSAAA